MPLSVTFFHSIPAI